MSDMINSKKSFPQLHSGHYLDNAATTQKPQAVLDAIVKYYSTINANPRRGVSTLSNQATLAFESGRKTIADFIAADEKNVIITKNTTESLNLIAYGWAMQHLKKDDEILLTIIEHHSNILPWQYVCEMTGAKLVYVNCDANYIISPEMIASKISEHTKLVAITHVSNVTGSILDVTAITKLAHKRGAKIVVDGAQAVAHFSVDVRELGVDWYCFSGHKLYGPTGIGVLYGTDDVLAKMQPVMRGGSMIDHVTKETATWTDIPHRFEAGTQDVAGVVGLQAAIHFLQHYDWDSIKHHEQELLKYVREKLAKIPGIKLYVPASVTDQCSAVSFTIDGIHPHDISQVVDDYNVTIRSGHHCAQPLMQHLGITGTARISLAVYNDEQDINALIEGLEQATRMFHGKRA